jgi:thiosulfate dehydrogenase
MRHPSLDFTTLSVSVLIAGSQLLRAETVVIDLTRWTPPDINTVGDDPFGKFVKYGHQLFTNAANEIGPSVVDASKRLEGNNLSCGNCHLQAGTQPYAMPMIGVWGQFPQYRAREGAVVTLEERINGCMQRSMHGRALSNALRENIATA